LRGTRCRASGSRSLFKQRNWSMYSSRSLTAPSLHCTRPAAERSTTDCVGRSRDRGRLAMPDDAPDGATFHGRPRCELVLVHNGGHSRAILWRSLALVSALDWASCGHHNAPKTSLMGGMEQRGGRRKLGR
jgi:hypothetical protein